MDDRDSQSTADDGGDGGDGEEPRTRESDASSTSQNDSIHDGGRPSMTEDGDREDEDYDEDGHGVGVDELRTNESRTSSRRNYTIEDNGSQSRRDSVGDGSGVEELQTSSHNHGEDDRDRLSSAGHHEEYQSDAEELRRSASRVSSTGHRYSVDDRDDQSKACDEGDRRSDGELRTRESGGSFDLQSEVGEENGEASGVDELQLRQTGASSSHYDGTEERDHQSSAGDDESVDDSHELLERLFSWFSDHPFGQSMTYTAFNRLRRCTGEPMVAEPDWLRALAVVAEQHPQHGVSRSNFEALSFGPPPCFGRYEDIGYAIQSAASHCRAAQAFVARFGIVVDDKGTKVIGLPQLQYLQQVLGVGFVIEEMQWREMLMLVRPYETHMGGLDWTTFAEVSVAPFFRGRVFGSLSGTLASIESMLVDRLGAGLHDGDQDVDGFATMHSEETVALTPAIAVVSTRGQVLTYEMSFTDTGDIGIGLQSFSLGYCVVVSSVRGQSAKSGHIIQPGDVVTRIDQEALVYDRGSNSSENEANERVDAARRLLQPKSRGQRRIRFHRPAASFQCAHVKATAIHFKATLHVFQSLLEL